MLFFSIPYGTHPTQKKDYKELQQVLKNNIAQIYKEISEVYKDFYNGYDCNYCDKVQPHTTKLV